MQFAARTNTGKLREINEDRYYFDTQHQLFAIADGMSGHESGDVASRIAVEVIQEWAETQASLQSDLGPMKKLAILDQLAEEANHRIYTATESTDKARGMGTTLIAGFLNFSYLAYLHVGDSRLYVLRSGEFVQITTDDTFVQKMVERNEITSEESRVHERRNIVTRAIGLRPTATFSTNAYPLGTGDIVLACTDGLHDMIVADDEIANIIMTASNIEEAAENLVNRALDYGGTDNVTVLLFTIG